MKIDGNNPIQNTNVYQQGDAVQNEKNKESALSSNQENTADNTRLNMTDELKLAKILSKELSSQDGIDHERVAEIKLKIQNKTLDILADDEKADDAAKRIAEKLISSEKS